MLWTGFLLYIAAILVVVVGAALAFGVTPVSPSELGFGYQFAVGVLGGIVYLHLYRSAYRKTISEWNTSS
jgi:zinc transporter ZupT